MSQMMKYLLPVLLFLPGIAAAGGGLEGTYQVIIKKQEEKKKSRWSIYDWLETKKKFALQDRWLALNTHDVVFEGYIGGEVQSLTNDFGDAFTSSETFDAKKGEAAFFYKIFGVRGSYADDTFARGWDGSFHVRLWGTGIQNTNLTVGYGTGHRNGRINGLSDEWNSRFAEAALTIYIFNFFGLEGVYQRQFSAETDNGFQFTAGDLYQGTGFFEFSFVRLYITLVDGQGSGSGWNAGARLYF